MYKIINRIIDYYSYYFYFEKNVLYSFTIDNNFCSIIKFYEICCGKIKIKIVSLEWEN